MPHVPAAATDLRVTPPLTPLLLHCRYDACAVKSDDVCYVQSSEKWIDMSPSPAEYENFYGDLYDVHFFEPRQGAYNRNPKPPLAFAVGRYTGKEGTSYARLNDEWGQMVVLRLTAHGENQPQNSPHGWDGGHARLRRHQLPGAYPPAALHHLLAPTPTTSPPPPPQYGCWTIVTPPWTDASTDFETGFDQNDAEKLEYVESTVAATTRRTTSTATLGPSSTRSPTARCVRSSAKTATSASRR